MSFHPMPMLDFSKTCRLCLSQEYDMIPISQHGSDSSAVALASKITATVSLEVADEDDMPGQICGNCFQRIDQWYSFKQVCHNSFAVLRQCVKGDKKDVSFHDSGEVSCDHMSGADDGSLGASSMTTDEMGNSLSCQICGKVFSNYNNRVFHEKKYHNIKAPPRKGDDMKSKKGEYICKVCSREFSRIENLKTHELRMHSNERSYFCDCGSGFIRKTDMVYHQSTHVKSSSPGLAPCPDELDKSLGCPICALPFPRIEKMNEHIELVHIDTKFQCSICLSKFLNKEELMWHQKHVMVASTPTPQNSWSHFICNVCNHNFSNINMCKSHVLRVHGASSGVKGVACCQNFIGVGLKEELTAEERKLPFGRKRSFYGPDPFFCSCCGKEFNNFGKSSSNRERHSSGSKSHICKDCGKSFLTSSRLKTHALTHTDVKPFACDVCQNKFRTLSNLLAHKKRHSAEPRYVCKTCGKEFLSYSGLSRHEILHTGVKDFACEECGKTFVTLQERRKHMKYHTGEKSHVCKYCDKAFFESGHLAIHLRSHLNEKPYSCLVCSRSFDSTTKLKRHKKTDAHLRRMNVNQPAKETSRPEWPTANQYYNEALNGGPSIYHI